MNDLKDPPDFGTKAAGHSSRCKAAIALLIVVTTSGRICCPRLRAAAIEPQPERGVRRYRPNYQEHNRPARPSPRREPDAKADCVRRPSRAVRFAAFGATRAAYRAILRSSGAVTTMMRSMRRRQSARIPSFSPRARASRTTSKISADSRTATAAGSLSKHFVHPSALRFNHWRMHDGIQFLQSAMAESEIGNACAVELAVRLNNFRPKCADDLVVHFVARLHEFAPQGIGLDDLRAKFTQHGCHSAFAAAQTTG